MNKVPRRLALFLGATAVCAAVLPAAVPRAQSGADDGPRYRNGVDLVRPDDYREWQFLSTGLGMTYEAEGGGAAGSGARPARFQNVFVNRSAYRAFKETGTWPDGSVFVLEIRRAASESSINVAGNFQSDLLALETTTLQLVVSRSYLTREACKVFSGSANICEKGGAVPSA